MDLRRLSRRAKELVEKRGGPQSVKQDAEELREIAKGSGSAKDKAKAAAAALKEPGAAEPTSRDDEQPAPPAETASGSERARAEEKVSGESRGKHKHAE